MTGYIVTGVGALLLSFNTVYIKIFGAALTICGGILVYQLNKKESVVDKNEILSRINSFKNELDMAKQNTNDEASKQSINLIENEFDDWANEFRSNYVERKLELVSSNLQAEQQKIELSKDYRYIYGSFFKILHSLIHSYNKIQHLEITVTEEKDLPANLYSLEALEFYLKIRFSKELFWIILLDIREPTKEKMLPGIVVDVLSNELHDRTLSLVRGFSFTLSIPDSTLEVRNTIALKQIDISGVFPLEEYERAFKISLRKLLEFQILKDSLNQT